MVTREELINTLTALAQQNYPLSPKAEREELLQAMLTCIGDPDPTLRDALIYPTFAEWILNDKLPTERQARLLETALDEEHLFYRIGERENDSVFTRTFSMLLAALVLYAHRHKPSLTASQVQHANERILAYTRQEQDLRGYVPEKGWAHAAAHAADALDELGRLPELEQVELREVLDAIGRLATREDAVYTHEEYERLSVAVEGIFEGGRLLEEAWVDWLDGLLIQMEERRDLLAGYNRYVNLKQFLRSLYFRLLRLDKPSGGKQAALDALMERIASL